MAKYSEKNWSTSFWNPKKYCADFGVIVATENDDVYDRQPHKSSKDGGVMAAIANI